MNLFLFHINPCHMALHLISHPPNMVVQERWASMMLTFPFSSMGRKLSTIYPNQHKMMWIHWTVSNWHPLYHQLLTTSDANINKQPLQTSPLMNGANEWPGLRKIELKQPSAIQHKCIYRLILMLEKTCEDITKADFPDCDTLDNTRWWQQIHSSHPSSHDVETHALRSL